jgi:ribosome-interacting GTPase 1
MEGYRTPEARFWKSFPILPIFAKEGMNLDEMKKEVFQLLNIIRIHAKTPGRKPDLTEPVILKTGSGVEGGALSVHKDVSVKLRCARIWGLGSLMGRGSSRIIRAAREMRSNCISEE